MKTFEQNYNSLVKDVYTTGEIKKGRNGITRSKFAKTLIFNLDSFPLLTKRRIFYKGVLGEFAALIRGPKSVNDFTKWGCNYWDTWADEEGKLELDYGNAWLTPVNQIDWLIKELTTNPNSRRLIVSGWRPDRVINNELSLPCCHHTYQFFVDKHNKLHLLWIQRSADLMIGVPSDAILAAVMLTSLANTVNLGYGSIAMTLGDTHIYEEHLAQTEIYLAEEIKYTAPKFTNTCKDIRDFKPSDINIDNYQYNMQLKFELKA